mmetsp:Transcript_11569/g.24988  ORF Transcript_11569/g.24988 Transcript_11569/m.24988 type:complete len:317 (-) Transcript_11569:644-1594(-)
MLELDCASDGGEQLANLDVSFDETLAGVLDGVLFAERHEQLACFREAVPRQRGPNVMLDLMAEAAGKPHVERRRVDVARGLDLHAYKVDVFHLVRLEHLHCVVPDREHHANKQSTERLAHGHKHELMPKPALQLHHQPSIRGVVHEKRAHFDCAPRVAAHKVPRGLGLEQHRLDHPRHARHAQNRPVEHLLVREQEPRQCFDLLRRALDELLAPQQQRVRVDVRIAAGGSLRHVGRRVVMIVLHLPPRHRKPLEHVAHKKPGDVVQHAVLEHLVMQKVVREPAALLPEQREDHCRENEHGERSAGAKREERRERQD